MHRGCACALPLAGSDFITFDEFVTCVRRELKKGPTVISHNELMSLWCALDISGDNMVSRDEVRRCMVARNSPPLAGEFMLTPALVVHAGVWLLQARPVEKVRVGDQAASKAINTTTISTETKQHHRAPRYDWRYPGASNQRDA
jgi:hypothetical protein